MCSFQAEDNYVKHKMNHKNEIISLSKFTDFWDVTVWKQLQTYLKFISRFQSNRLCNFGQIPGMSFKTVLTSHMVVGFFTFPSLSKEIL